MVEQWEGKAGFKLLKDYHPKAAGSDAKLACIVAEDVVDLTAKLTPDGRLDWDVPEGQWVILRLGRAAIGTTNHPARPGAIGLEADKLDRRATEKYFRGLMDRLGPAVGNKLDALLCDSWEAGMENAPAHVFDEFKKRRGYDPTPYLPALTGLAVASQELSERFLRDYRRTLADLAADEHYAVLRQLCAARGMTFYAEAPGIGGHYGDKLQCKSRVDIPMAEFWCPNQFSGAAGYNRHSFVQMPAIRHIVAECVVSLRAQSLMHLLPENPTGCRLSKETTLLWKRAAGFEAWHQPAAVAPVNAVKHLSPTSGGVRHRRRFCVAENLRIYDSDASTTAPRKAAVQW